MSQVHQREGSARIAETCALTTFTQS